MTKKHKTLKGKKVYRNSKTLKGPELEETSFESDFIPQKSLISIIQGQNVTLTDKIFYNTQVNDVGIIYPEYWLPIYGNKNTYSGIIILPYKIDHGSTLAYNLFQGSLHLHHNKVGKSMVYKRTCSDEWLKAQYTQGVRHACNNTVIKAWREQYGKFTTLDTWR